MTTSKQKRFPFDIMSTQCTENNNFNQSRGQRNKHRSTNKHIYRLLRLTPIIFVVAGAVLTVVGNSASFKSCKIAGPVVITAGGLFLLIFTVWNNFRQEPLPETTNCEEPENTREQNLNQVVSDDRPRSTDQLGPIHHFEIRFSSESPGKDMVPPSYEEAVSNG